jgi:hypothetical protein
LLLLAGCFTRRVETVSHPRTLNVRVTPRCEAAAVLEQYRDGYQLVPLVQGTAVLDVPSLSGGYSERNGRVFDNHDPWESPMFRLRRRQVVVRELSVNQVDALAHDADGRAILDC